MGQTEMGENEKSISVGHQDTDSFQRRVAGRRLMKNHNEKKGMEVNEVFSICHSAFKLVV